MYGPMMPNVAVRPLRVKAGTGRRSRSTAALELGPAAVFWTVFFLAPMVILVRYSFYDAGFLRLIPAFQLDNYREAITNDLYREVIVRTLLIGLVTATIVVVLAYAFTYAITFVFPRRRELLFFLVMVALFSGYLVRIYAWRTILGEEGIVNSLLTSTGIVDEPVRFLIYSRFAVVLTMTNILLPFAILPLYSAMQNVPRDAIDAARSLGGGVVTVFRTVTFPMTITGARAAFAFAFVLTCGDYVTPTLVGGTNGIMVGNVIADQFGVAFNWPLGAALAVTIMVAVLVVFAIVSKLMTLVSR